MRKKLLIVVAIVLVICIGTFNGCTRTKKLENTVKIKMVTPAGGPTLAVLSMLEKDLLEKYNIELEYKMISATDVLASELISESADIAIIPTNLAANLYNKGIEYKIGAVVVWGNLYLISNSEIETIEDIKGKELTAFGQGLTPDIILNYILKNNKIDTNKDISLNYVPGASAIAPLFISEQIDLALVAEPMLSTIKLKKPDTKIVLDIQHEWEEITTNGQSYPQATVVINSKFVDNQQKAVELVLNELENSIKFASDNPQGLGELAEKYEIGLTKEVVISSISGMNLNYIPVKEARDTIENYLTILKEFNEKAIGGKLPDESIYMEE